MIFKRDIPNKDEKETDSNYELTEKAEKDFIEINEDISKALVEMKKEKESEKDNSDEEGNDEDEEEEKNINDFDLDLFSSNNSIISSMDPFTDNSEKTFKSVHIELSKNNLEKNFKKDFNNLNRINNLNNVNNINLNCTNKNIDNKNYYKNIMNNSHTLCIKKTEYFIN